jgi:hypothetical protein
LVLSLNFRWWVGRFSVQRVNFWWRHYIRQKLYMTT